MFDACRLPRPSFAFTKTTSRLVPSFLLHQSPSSFKRSHEQKAREVDLWEASYREAYNEGTPVLLPTMIPTLVEPLIGEALLSLFARAGVVSERDRDAHSTLMERARVSGWAIARHGDGPAITSAAAFDVRLWEHLRAVARFNGTGIGYAHGGRYIMNELWGLGAWAEEQRGRGVKLDKRLKMHRAFLGAQGLTQLCTSVHIPPTLDRTIDITVGNCAWFAYALGKLSAPLVLDEAMKGDRYFTPVEITSILGVIGGRKAWPFGSEVTEITVAEAILGEVRCLRGTKHAVYAVASGFFDVRATPGGLCVRFYREGITLSLNPAHHYGGVIDLGYVQTNRDDVERVKQNPKGYE